MAAIEIVFVNVEQTIAEELGVASRTLLNFIKKS